ncbi:uncharacterized protein FA14DRAFT_54006 [Meira miltonrushii]|uniref:Uncharacterized protein n=1 Tax=Meira miltonrushii TaxID=1280837 RepID=A0A316VFJ8_9BASI|nr:uncharacterized protein FA14DRAFT_54006 [Meira miltonrushii]PWN36310.1 hypothetical protein FA14DRAFT_54006 [Meira miltonrushii]
MIFNSACILVYCSASIRKRLSKEQPAEPFFVYLLAVQGKHFDLLAIFPFSFCCLLNMKIFAYCNARRARTQKTIRVKEENTHTRTPSQPLFACAHFGWIVHKAQ